MTPKPYLSTRDLALAIGVSESSIKRWADEGSLVAQRTLGGHRRIATSDAMRFLRERRTQLVRPELLGLPAAPAGMPVAEANAQDQLERLLSAGDAEGALTLLCGLYLRGSSVAELVDGPLRGALAEIGRRWLDHHGGIAIEHHAVEIAQRALHRLAGLLPAPPQGALLALGAAPAGDPYALPSLAVATVLSSEGLRVRNLSANLPLTSLTATVSALRPALVWLSLSAPLPISEVREVPALLDATRSAGAGLVLGGRAVESAPAALTENAFVGRSMGELVAFVRGWRSAGERRATG
jgi:excisionase family DNA binding protein